MNTAGKTRRRSGQTTVEFVIMATMVTLMLVILSLLLYSFKEYGGRVLNLMASEYP